MSLSRSAEAAADPFSEVLAALGTRSVRGTGLEAEGDWALSFDGRGRLKFVALTSGGCWLLLPNRPPEAMNEGDVFLLSNTRYAVASDPAVEPVDGMALYAAPGHDVVRLGTGRETVMIGGGSGFADGCAPFVLDALPPFLRIDSTSPNAETIALTIAALHREVRSDGVGRALVAERLAEILVVEAVRAYVASRPAENVGWIAALGDERIARAIGLMHGDVARRWTVPSLAREVGMSRSAFAQRFSRRVGQPPLDYLTRWRMLLAQRKLAAGAPVAAIAASVGYESQSAFAHAFKRTTGRTPRDRRS
ncbi:AraC family transcriptional regulator [Aureimonas leprariae]|uniref:AraC family transcriptional regulator n=1 Tax=Plantimonas leprariae TaxID=2615207 RepID=A0A7V7PKF2_9HYPH|nr:AraC family transcriptional regulator [Aureimonas leprariae]KAB0676306.1 AraC family transcriptional regulator [Aureimonas leprariae]